MTSLKTTCYSQFVQNNDVLIDPVLRTRAELAAVRHDMSLIDFYAQAIEMQIARMDTPDGEPCPACGEGGNQDWQQARAAWQQRHDTEVAARTK